MDQNPWDVSSIFDFTYFNCPECDTKSQQKQEFINHAFAKHKKALEGFQNVTDGSLDDVIVPTRIKKEDFVEPAIEENETKELVKKDPTKIPPDRNARRRNAAYNTEPVLCTTCGKTIANRRNLKKHEKEKHGIISATVFEKRKSNIICSKCNSKFENPTELNTHVLECCKNDLKDFPCIDCDLRWASGPALNIHLKIDHKHGEIYTCEQCGKCLKKLASIKSHMKVVHEKKKDIICHLCGTGFARNQGLKLHIQTIHEKSGKFKCEHCDFRSISQYKLDSHINEVHTKAIKFNCNLCNFFCYRREGLGTHIKHVHLKIRPHKCSKCPEAYIRRKELEKHKQLTNH